MNNGFVVEKIGGWYFPSNDKDLTFASKEILTHMVPIIYSSYMSKCKTIIDNNIDDLKTANKYWLKKNLITLINERRLEPMIRIESDTNTRINIQILQESDQKLTIFTIATFNDDEITYVNAYSVELNKKSSECISPMFTGFFHGPSESTILKSIDVYLKEGSFEIGVLYIADAVEALVNNKAVDRYPIHTNVEMEMLNSLVEHFGKQDAQKRTLAKWTRKDKPIIETFNMDSASDFDAPLIPEVKPGFRTDNVPEISLSDKEWDYILNYTLEHDLLHDDPTDLTPYVTHPRYGNIYRMDVTDDDGTVELIFKILLGDDYMKLYIIHQLNKDTSIYLRLRISDLENFVFNDCFNDSEIILVNKDLTHAPKSADIKSPIMSMVDKVSKQLVGITNLILSLLIVMKDRPQRTRMVKCTTRKPRNTNSKHSEKDQTKVRTVRILKTVYEAKKLVAESQNHERAEAIYVMEEWDRQGHYRTTKTGKQIWIDATTCHRRLPLNTAKEIKIKL